MFDENLTRKSKIPSYVDGGTHRSEATDNSSGRKKHVGALRHVMGQAVADLVGDHNMPEGQAVNLVGGRAGRGTGRGTRDLDTI